MFLSTRVTLCWAVPPVLAGCLWLVTLSKWLGTAFLFCFGKRLFIATVTQYQSSFGFQELFSKIFSPFPDRLPGCSVSGRCLRWSCHIRPPKFNPAACACSLHRYPHAPCRGCAVRFWRSEPRLIRARRLAAPQSHLRHQAAPDPSQSAWRRLQRAFRRCPLC